MFAAASCGNAEQIKSMNETIGCDFGWVDENDDGCTVLHRLEASQRVACFAFWTALRRYGGDARLSTAHYILDFALLSTYACELY